MSSQAMGPSPALPCLESRHASLAASLREASASCKGKTCDLPMQKIFSTASSFAQKGHVSTLRNGPRSALCRMRWAPPGTPPCPRRPPRIRRAKLPRSQRSPQARGRGKSRGVLSEGHGLDSGHVLTGNMAKECKRHLKRPRKRLEPWPGAASGSKAYCLASECYAPRATSQSLPMLRAGLGRGSTLASPHSVTVGPSLLSLLDAVLHLWLQRAHVAPLPA